MKTAVSQRRQEGYEDTPSWEDELRSGMASYK